MVKRVPINHKSRCNKIFEKRSWRGCGLINEGRMGNSSPEGVDLSSDSLLPVPVDKVEDFIKILKDDFPSSIHVYSFFHTLLNWRTKRTKWDVNFLAPEGDPSNGIVLSWITENSLIGTTYTSDKSSVLKLTEAIETSRRLPFLTKEYVSLTCLTENSYQPLKTLTSGPGWCLTCTVVYWLPWYIARDMEVHLPENVELRELSVNDAAQVDSIWSHRYPGSEEFIKDTIDLNFGYGIFKGDKLISCLLLCFFGGISILQTDQAEKMKGYGQAVVEAVTKKLGDIQFDVYLSIDFKDEAAISFFKALGFRYAFRSVWASKGVPKAN